MSNYSIKDLEHLSGIKAHTIRIWEQRYNFIKPSRSETNIRSYDDLDLKLILNVSLLKDNGFKISHIADMSSQEIAEEVLLLTEKHLRFPEQIHALTLAMIDMDEDRFEKIMSSNILKLGFEKTMLNIVYPFLSKIGVLWQTGSINPAQEHFISNLIRQKLIVAIDGQYSSDPSNAPKYLLYLPEGELHELSLLFADYVIRSRHNKSIYLGQSLPLQDLVSVYNLHKPEFILSILTSVPGIDQVQGYVNKLSGLFPESTILLSGYQVIGQDIQTPDNVIIFTRSEQITSFVEEHSAEA
ncbi:MULTISPECIES: MerR family transcriptional regulator [unclassified Imperialibacter]|uniref:MerR family transcriptional regulator n=1 Tax=unclassified Imperialibacter TaxID=2629706 RepID=UPI00125A2F15|nr:MULTISPECIES: MerR family transcriptional regulator [unclassified Imperialibacter]CAD5246309.1 DNA-binding transcriptional MerR regulator [Imperialibacter sp. 75]CAD5246338.1 DNA-binding transcriptional MerR regulator [Imperialibacter sp. 89]VVS96100.1 Helix-turn-helix-type transcriptional regulator [Imperialibacter sp. EC-SDR9]